MTNLIQDMRCPDRELNPARHTLPMEPISTVYGVSAYRGPDWFIPDNCCKFIYQFLFALRHIRSWRTNMCQEPNV